MTRRILETAAFLLMPLWIAPAILLLPFVFPVVVAWIETRRATQAAKQGEKP